MSRIGIDPIPRTPSHTSSRSPSSPYAALTSHPTSSIHDQHRLSRPASVPIGQGRNRRNSKLPAPNSGLALELVLPPSPPLPTRPCEVCQESKVTFFCVLCDGSFCSECWDKERPHQKGKTGPDGFPHEKADPRVVNRLKQTFTPPTDPNVQRVLHIEDEDTAWFGIERDASDLPIFRDYGRFATLMASSATGQFLTRYPQLVSFIGQTGAGKSTIIKMLIEQQASRSVDPHSQLFPRPIVGSARNDNTPTSGDVHLYADPATYLEPLPLLYADCEGLDGGEAVPIGNRHKESDPGTSVSSKKKVDPETDERKRLKKRWKIARGSQRDIAWATSPEKQKRQYAVTELYPRLLYTFSDVIVFVLQKAQTFEAQVLSKLIGWAHSSMEKSLNQPALPHAIIALNATDMGVDERQWDVEIATQTLMTSVAGAIARDSKYREYADYFTSRGKTIRTMEDLLLCYYSSVRVVRIPTKGRYMLIDEQVTKLHKEITTSCSLSYYAKRKARMLSTTDELQVYLQCAFDHFSNNLDTPFNFIEVAFKNNPIPQDFGGSMLKLAAAVQASGYSPHDGPRLFRELSKMVASCIMLDCARHDLHGPVDHLLNQYYIDHCDYALEDFCALFWQCSYVNERRERCVNYKEGHSKGHQNDRGKILGTGEYQSDFSPDAFQDEWLKLLLADIGKLQNDLGDRSLRYREQTEKTLAGDLHQEVMQSFYGRLGGAYRFKTHAACFCCLREPPEHPLPCGHVLCTPCVYAYGQRQSSRIYMDRCPLHKDGSFSRPWAINFKPALAGVRILTLDGGGIRGIVELEALHAVERMIGVNIPIHQFFDLIVGTSTGGILSLGLGTQHWSVEDCIKKFVKLADRAFTPKLPGMRIGTRYRTTPMVQALKEVFPHESLFGGNHQNASSYHTKVAVTATAETGDQPVVLTNYNRAPETQPTYTFVRPDQPSHELAIWEAARSTSAAPGYFKPHRNLATQQGYLDGALYYNNPVKIALHESKLIWPEVADRAPDILLSVGTGHHGKETTGYAECMATRRGQFSDRSSINTEIIDVPKPRDRLRGPTAFLKNFPFGNLLNIMLNRVDNLLHPEQIWMEFRNEVLEGASREDRGRYQRLNPNLGFRPPKLDDKSKLGQAQVAARESLKTSTRDLGKLARIAHRLIASCFYSEKLIDAKPIEGGGYELYGKIRCRFSDASEELRELGRFLRNKQQNDLFQPSFRIHEVGRQVLAINKVITPERINRMITHAKFDSEKIQIHVSEKMGPTFIGLVLLNLVTRNEEVVPISGFPCPIVLNSLQKVTSRDTAQEGESSRARRPTRRARASRGGSNGTITFNADDKPGQRESDSATSSLSDKGGALSPRDEFNDWISRRARAARSTGHVRRAPPPPDPRSSQMSPIESPGPSSSTPNSPPLNSAPLQTSTIRIPEESAEEDDSEDDDPELQQALALSLEQAQNEANARANRFTMGGTNLEDLQEALRISVQVQ